MKVMDSSYFFLALLGITLTTVFAGCPDEDKIAPCECEEDDFPEQADVILYCSSTSLNEMKSALSAIDKSNTIELVLDDIKLGALPSNFFSGYNIQKLDISHCDLDSLNGDGGKALSGLEDTLEELEIVSSFTEENVKTKLDLSHMRKLSELDLSFNAITHLSNDWFANGPSSLTRLLLSNNAIEKVDDQVFANLNNLESLYFDGNRFGPIKRSMLPNPATRLEILELDNNALTNVPEDLFTNMPELRSLSLRTNGIRRYEEITFKPIWSRMDAIDLRGNPIECDSHIDWMKTTPTPAFVSGKCVAPHDMKDVDLGTLVKKLE